MKKEILEKYFGYTEFRGVQEKVIDLLCDKKPVLAVMATGAGKSICFQIPGLVLSGLTIVISPLISLIVDQVRTLKKHKISASFLIGDMSFFETKKVYDDLNGGKLKFLYLSPERLTNRNFISIIKNVTIAQVIVDEAHCISMWGNDFRKSYQIIPAFIACLSGKVNIGLFTATANDKVIQDIISILKIDELAIVKTNSDRANLYYGVAKPKIKFDYLLKYLIKHNNDKGIIYVLTRKKVTELAMKLETLNFEVVSFHGGMENEMKQSNQKAFIEGKAKIMIATNAFGMGVNIPNIRYVILYEMPISLEDLSQQFGRCSRDGKKGECILIYRENDIKTGMYFINGDKEKLKQIKRVIKFAETKECLHQFMIRYFDNQKSDKCYNCSNCIKHIRRKKA